jgi:hypothetical protein
VGKGGVGRKPWVFADFAFVTNDIYDSAWLYFTPQLEVIPSEKKATGTKIK